ncbi:MAG: chlorite dismutase family protein [Cellulomonadaceae bacterium]|nr:chlorite dismutase family protein [Cellulomonadaceae bacterium]
MRPDADETTPPTADPGSGPWAVWHVLRRPDASAARAAGPGTDAADLATVAADLGPDVTLRGIYDVSAMRADADLLLWLHGDSAEALQAAVRQLRRSAELAPLTSTWSAMGVHRPAEFSADHAPAYMRGAPPLPWVTVYPFVRSYEWYVLPLDERRAMLGQHGRMGRDYPQVQANTIASFALGDYEWLLALEAEQLTDLVDLMRHLRATEARRHVREEIPFFTGRRIGAHEVAEVVR